MELSRSLCRCLVLCTLALPGFTQDVMPDGKPLPEPAPEEKPEVFPAPDSIAILSVEPAVIALSGAVDYAQVIVTATMKDGSRTDATRLAKFETPAAIANVNSWGLLTPVGAGEGKLTVTVGKSVAEVPVRVQDIDAADKSAPPPLDYIRDVQPVISKLGCNAGTCHGAKEGKNGFKLSLRGYDPLFDVRALTDDLAGRRVNVASPDRRSCC